MVELFGLLSNISGLNLIGGIEMDIKLGKILMKVYNITMLISLSGVNNNEVLLSAETTAAIINDLNFMKKHLRTLRNDYIAETECDATEVDIY
mgnify:CR=1 FL=1